MESCYGASSSYRHPDSYDRSPESSVLLVHLDRALKNERVQCVERVQRLSLELSRAQAVIGAATQRAEHAESRASVAEQNASAASLRAHAAEARAQKAERDLESAKSDWARDRQDILARTDVAPLDIIRRLTRELVPDQQTAEVARAADLLARSLNAGRHTKIDDALATPFQAATPPTFSQQRPAPAQDQSSQRRRTDQEDPPGGQRPGGRVRDAMSETHDEMDKLLRKYQHAKEKLKALERMYPDS